MKHYLPRTFNQSRVVEWVSDGAVVTLIDWKIDGESTGNRSLFSDTSNKLPTGQSWRCSIVKQGKGICLYFYDP